MGGLFAELKRRNVFRVAIAYAVGSWLIAQVATTLEDALNLPGWFDTVFVAGLLIGFPIALIISWAYEVTPAGLKKTAEVDADASITHSTGKRLNYVTIGAVVLLIVSFFVQPYLTGRSEREVVSAPPTQSVQETDANRASVAVLPFVDLSPEGDQEYFSDGISEEILNVLAKIPDLHVTSRSSAFAFKGKDINIPEVADHLGVAHVLEGSVRKAGTTLRITAQLIEAETDKHLWSETYDRELKNVFQIQDEISAAIVDALKASLGVTAGASARVNQTANPEAYTEHLLGQHAIHKRTKGDIQIALTHFEKAIELDPNYAPAHVGFALAHYLLGDSNGAYGSTPIKQAIAKAQPAITRALELNPNNSEAHAVQGLIFNAQDEFTKSNTSLEKAIALNPSNTDARVWYAQTLGDLQRPADRFQAYKDAYAVDPLAPLVLSNYANDLRDRRMFDELRHVVQRLKVVNPSNGAFREALLIQAEQGWAEGMSALLEVTARFPENLRVRRSASLFLAQMGLGGAARHLWPDQFGTEQLELAIASPEQKVEVARSNFEANPDSNDNAFQLMVAYWNVGEVDKALVLANSILSRLPEDQRDIHFANWIIAVEDVKKGNRQAAITRLSTLETNVMRVINLGIKSNAFIGAAVARWMHGDLEGAKNYFQQLVETGDTNAQNLRQVLERIELDKDPEFTVFVDRIQKYRDTERLKFLTMACGEPGFEVWTPKPETCTEYGVPTGN